MRASDLQNRKGGFPDCLPSPALYLRVENTSISATSWIVITYYGNALYQLSIKSRKPLILYSLLDAWCSIHFDQAISRFLILLEPWISNNKHNKILSTISQHSHFISPRRGSQFSNYLGGPSQSISRTAHHDRLNIPDHARLCARERLLWTGPSRILRSATLLMTINLRK